MRFLNFKLAVVFLLFCQPCLAKTIRVGIVSGPQVHVMALAKKLAKDQYQLDIETVVFTNYQIPNEALNSGDIDANIFQTNAFLQKSVEFYKYDLDVIGNTFIFPMGIYSKKIKKLSEIKSGALITIPSDQSNQARALRLLKQADLIDIKAGHEENPSLKDIVENPKRLSIRALDAAQIARSAIDADAVVLNNDFVLSAGFQASQALFKEDPNHATAYINVIVAQTKKKNNLELKQLVQVMHSTQIIKKTQELNPGALKAW